MEKLITLSENDWHYKLIRFTFDINPKEMFMSLCPYFWITIASLLVFPIVALWKSIKWIFCGIEKVFMWLADLFYDKVLYKWYLDGLTEGQLYYLAHMGYDNRVQNNYSKFNLLPFNNYKKALKDAMERRNITYEIIETYEKAFFEEIKKLSELNKNRIQKEINRNYKVADAKKQMRKKLNFIIDITKYFCMGVALLVITFIFFVFTSILVQFLCIVIYCLSLLDVPSILTALKYLAFITIIAVIVTILIKLLSDYYYKYTQNELYGYKLYLGYPVIILVKICHFIIAKIVFDIIIMTVIYGIIKGITEGFKEFGGIFTEYFSASYSDYCPGIDWEDKK